MSGDRAAVAVGRRVAVLGAESPEGVRVREALESRAVPGVRVDLFGATGGEAVISEYAGEARLIQEPDLDALERHGVVFVCEPGTVAERLRGRADTSLRVLDLTPSGAGTPAHPVWAPPGERGVLRVPHAVSLAATAVLRPLAARYGIGRVIGTALLSASEQGEAGVDELRQQVSSLLSFSAGPTDTFGRTLAFNALPHGTAACDASGLEQVVSGEVSSLVDGVADVRFRFVRIAMFHGLALALHVAPREAVAADGLDGVWSGADGVALADDGGTPLDASIEPGHRVVLGSITPDGVGGVWLWVVSTEPGVDRAATAVEIAVEAGAV